MSDDSRDQAACAPASMQLPNLCSSKSQFTDLYGAEKRILIQSNVRSFRLLGTTGVNPVWSRNSCDPWVVVLEKAAEALSTSNRWPTCLAELLETGGTVERSPCPGDFVRY